MHPMDTNTKFDTVGQFIQFVGRKRFEAELGVKTQVVTRAIRDDLMPARWFLSVRGLCNELGVMTPEHLFRWQHGHCNKQNVYHGETIKVGDTIPSEGGA